MLIYSLLGLFHFDVLAFVMIFLVGFIGTVVSLFATRYMQGDKHFRRFLTLLIMLIVTVMTMVATDNIYLMLSTWAISNALLIVLMIHKPQWRAALNAGRITATILAVGFLSLLGAFLLLHHQTRETSIQGMLQHFNPNDALSNVAIVLILIAAMTQSALWPFQRWLLSSLNSPTPVSAIMHAGLVNGGGILLVRFAPMFLAQPILLNSIFLLGIITAALGTLWKLMQHDVKRMLACSTMGQMGFMFAQCGLGLFPAAIAHLCWHGMFKANLFLASNSCAQEKRLDGMNELTVHKFGLALVSGLLASYFFSIGLHSVWLAKDTTLILITLAFITASQFSLSLLLLSHWKKLPVIMILTSTLAYFYGLSVYAIEFLFKSLHVLKPQPLNTIHIISFVLVAVIWITVLFKDKLFITKKVPHLALLLYMKFLNASQPHPTTITSHRNDYRYE